MNKKTACVAGITAAAWFGFGANALAVEDLVETCNNCHGVESLGMEKGVPIISGLSEFYHADQLYFYRDGERPCAEVTGTAGDATTMCALAADLSDDQIDALAAHYAALPFEPAQQEFDAALAAKGEAVHESNCAVCHSDGGSNPADDAGILAGQWIAYLEETMRQYRSGEREQPAPMKKKVDALSDEDVTALVHYYASQQ